MGYLDIQKTKVYSYRFNFFEEDSPPEGCTYSQVLKLDDFLDNFIKARRKAYQHVPEKVRELKLTTQGLFDDKEKRILEGFVKMHNDFAHNWTRDYNVL